jgi:hypothetical protein
MAIDKLQVKEVEELNSKQLSQKVVDVFLRDCIQNDIFGC